MKHRPYSAGANLDSSRHSSGVPLALYALGAYLVAVTIFGKGPCYLIYPPFYWGEVTLAIATIWAFFLVLKRGITPSLVNLTTLMVILFMLIGAVILGQSIRSYGALAIRDSCIWYYGAFYFIGAIVASRPSYSDILWRWLTKAWIAALLWWMANLVSGNFFVRLSPVLPWRGSNLLGNSGSESVQHAFLGGILFLLGFPARKQGLTTKGFGVILALAAIISLAFGYGRGVKVAGVCAVFTAIAATFGSRKSIWPASRWFILVVILSLGLSMAAILAGPAGLMRAGRMERFLKIGESKSGTSVWRRRWWTSLYDEVNEKSPTFGLGFGTDLAAYSPDIGRQQTKWGLRSPHNFNMTVFSRMGFVGLALWLSVLVIGIGTIFLRVRRGRYRRHIYQAKRRRELTFWLMFVVMTWVNSSFGVLMEGPVLGIWFWFALGFSLGRSAEPSGFESSLSSSDCLVRHAHTDSA